jgi:hypothetical protein
MIIEIVNRCADMGMEPPFITCTVSPNGSVLAVRVKGDETPNEPLAEHYEKPGFLLPMTIVVVDQRNEAARVTIAASGQKTWH